MEARQFEEVVACAPSDEEIAEQKTNAMVEEVKTISKQAAVLNIQSEADYNDAAEIGKGIRARLKPCRLCSNRSKKQPLGSISVLVNRKRLCLILSKKQNRPSPVR